MYITALIEGLVWSVLWIIYAYVIVTKYPWQMMHDYPEDIQKAARAIRIICITLKAFG